jgi:two-component system cell cycle response regulator
MPAHILVIDDNPVNLKLVCDILECEGYIVERAVDAEAALHKTGSTGFDLILTDIGLPGMDGLALTRILKANHATMHIPIVAITAFAMKGDDLKVRQAGCDGYITKPIDTRRLVGQVAAFLLPPKAEKADEPVLFTKAAMRIMVVEDEPASSKLISVVLTSEGHEVREAKTAEAAFEAIKTERPDLVLLDLKLPGMGGIELVRLLKERPETSGMPIIAMTAYPDAFPKRQAIEAGCEAYIVKPINTRTITKQLAATAFRDRPVETEN